jgi:putative SOS response-associated peptidase YedK
MKWGLVPSFAKRPEDYDVFKGGRSTFNARVEGLLSNGMWKRLLETHRGVVLFDGFYEWKAEKKGKTPMFIRNRDEYDGRTISPSAGSGQGKTLEDTPASAEVKEAVQPQDPVLPVQEAGVAEAEVEGPAHAPLMFAALFDNWRPKGATHDVPCGDEALDSVTLVTMDSDGTPVARIHDRMPIFLTPDTAAMWLDPSVSYEQAIGPILRAARNHAKQQLLMYEVSNLVSNVKNESPDCVLPKKELDAKKLSQGLGKFFTKKAPAQGPPTMQAQEPPPATKRKLDGEVASGASGLPTKAARQASPEAAIVLD